MAKGKLTSDKRQRIEKMVLDVVKILDNDKMLNYEYYKNFFKNISDPEFEKWANTMGHELDDTIQIFQLPFEEMKLNQIEKAAKYLDLPLEEYIYYRHNDPNGIRTKVRVPVGYVHLKRTQQMLSKKNRYAMDSDETDFRTGQVRGDSKVATVSDTETFFLTSIHADKALEEFLGPRADNQYKKQQLYQQIARDGFASLDTMENDITQSTTLNTIDTYLLVSGIKSDLVTNSLKTRYTIEKDLRKK